MRRKREVCVHVGVCVSRKVRVHRAARGESIGLRLELQSTCVGPHACCSSQ